MQAQLPTQRPEPPILDAWTSIWTRPRETIRQIVETDPKRHVILLTVLPAFASVILGVTIHDLDEDPSSRVLLMIQVVVAPLIALLLWYLEAAMLTWTGHWLGGRASAVQVRAALAWSNVPVISTMGLYLLTGGFALLPTWIVGLWSFIIYLQCLGEVHHFSAWRALAAWLIGWLILGLAFCTVFGVFLAATGTR